MAMNGIDQLLHIMEYNKKFFTLFQGLVMQMCEQCAPNPIIKSGYALGLYNVVGEAGLLIPIDHSDKCFLVALYLIISLQPSCYTTTTTE